MTKRSSNRGKRLAGMAAALLLTAPLMGCGSAAKPAVVPADTDAQPVVTVTVIDNRFDPATVTIAPGQAVRWIFQGKMEHDVVAADGSFVSELMTTGEYVKRFDTAGEFAYDCSVHPEMTGVVRVK